MLQDNSLGEHMSIITNFIHFNVGSIICSYVQAGITNKIKSIKQSRFRSFSQKIIIPDFWSNAMP